MSARIFMLSARAQAIVNDEARRALRNSRVEFPPPQPGDSAMTVCATWMHDEIDGESLRARLAMLGPGHIVVLKDED